MANPIRAIEAQEEYAFDIADRANDTRRTKVIVQPTWDDVSQYDPGGVQVKDLASSDIRYLILTNGESLQILYGSGKEDEVEY